MSDPNAAPDPAQRGARTPEPGGHGWGPRRIVCLTEETTEWLYLLGEEARIVGISGYTVRPRRARVYFEEWDEIGRASCRERV